MKFHHRSLVFASILIGSLLLPLISNAIEIVTEFRPLTAYFSQCPPHYMYLHQGSQDTTCFDYVQPGLGTMAGRPIIGGYTCRFMHDMPPDDACPDGTTLRRSSDVSYRCTSENPIAASERNCYQALGYNFTMNSFWENELQNSPDWRNGFHCQIGIGFPENVCAAEGAFLFGSETVDDYCCVYLEEE